MLLREEMHPLLGAPGYKIYSLPRELVFALI